MIHIISFRTIGILLLCLFIGACNEVPEPKVLNLSIQNIEASVFTDASVVLGAEVSTDQSEISQCGFFYGKKGNAMVDVPANMEGQFFKGRISGLEYDTEYVYKAYVTNGRNVIYSDMYSFRTLERQPLSISPNELFVPYEGGKYTVYVIDSDNCAIAFPSGVDWVNCSLYDSVCTVVVSYSYSSEPRECDLTFIRTYDDSECVLHIVQGGIKYEMGLSSYETYLDGTMHQDFSMSVSGNSDFEVQIPEDTPWVTCRVEGRVCNFHVEKNMTKNERESEVVFRSLDYDATFIYRIVQSGTSLECYEIEVSHLKQLLVVPILPDLDIMGWGPVDGWVTVLYEKEGQYVVYSVDENNSAAARKANLNILQENNLLEYYVNLTQHSYLETIDFKDPVTKKVCVDLWDLSVDGELSYEEAAAVSLMTNDAFDGYAISTFDELKYFPDSIWSDYLFEGSSIVSVSLPHNPDGSLRRGMFLDCRNLQNVDIGFRKVTDEAFMNCTSLKEIDAAIVGRRSFMGCTSLKEVNQREMFIPEMAFKNCSSLVEIKFDERYMHSDSYASVSKEAFYGCQSLSEISLHRKINLIEDRAFYGCSSLKDVYLVSGIPPELGEDAFAGTSPDLKIHVPASSVNAYKKQWPELVDRIVAD